MTPRRYTLTPVASAGERFAGFAPYVPAVSGGGVVAFQATLRAGGSGVYAAMERGLETLVETGALIGEVVSHPAINAAGACACYATAPRSDQPSLFGSIGGPPRPLAPSAGPLGPTMNSAGAVAFRAPTPSGAEAIFRADGASLTPIAQTGPRYSAFHGLPVIDGGARVLFRADTAAGSHALVLADSPTTRHLIETGPAFKSLAPFPAMNEAGLVAFCAVRHDGTSAAYALRDGDARPIVASGSAFESIRGVLLDAAGPAVLIATPRAGTLGIFAGPDPQRDAILSIGSRLLGSTVTDFALNPVSINSEGQLAIRVALADGSQHILRADPVRRTS